VIVVHLQLGATFCSYIDKQAVCRQIIVNWLYTIVAFSMYV
jgi:hypothetical protein